MSKKQELSLEAINDCDLDSLAKEKQFCGSSISSYLNQVAKKMEDLQRTNCSATIKLLSQVSSMCLVPDSINKPFKPAYIDFKNGRRTFDLEDISKEHLIFFAKIFEEINNQYLSARLADILWLLSIPRNSVYAANAIDAYTSREINPTNWLEGLKEEIERALQLCLQIKDQERLSVIKKNLHKAQSIEYADCKFFNLWVAELMDRLKIDRDFREDIATGLFSIATKYKVNKDNMAANSYFELATKKFKQLSNIEKEVECLIGMAQCLENEADSKRVSNNLVANSFYEDALHAFRKIPRKYRESFEIENKIIEIQKKITLSGKAAIDEMSFLKIESTDISELAESAINHVKGKQNSFLSLRYLAGLALGPNLDQITQHTKSLLSESFFSNIFSGRHLSDDGRLVAKTPPLTLEKITENEIECSDIERQIHQQFSIEMQLTVEGMILPALHQICLEHRFTKELLVQICQASSLVPDDRVCLMGSALWLGFEREFGLAIHLLCPQFENIVRVKLKEAGAITSTVDKSGIETENGLSTIMKLSEAETIFGRNLSFEINAVFNNPLGFNARNLVAHGLLNDESATYSVASIYAWWMTLRMIMNSISYKFE